MHHGCPVRTIVHPTQYCVRDIYHPEVVQHVFPLETINRHNRVVINRAVVTHCTRDVMGPTYYVNE